jgi:hypothetical protein
LGGICSNVAGFGRKTREIERRSADGRQSGPSFERKEGRADESGDSINGGGSGRRRRREGWEEEKGTSGNRRQLRRITLLLHGWSSSGRACIKDQVEKKEIYAAASGRERERERQRTLFFPSYSFWIVSRDENEIKTK